MPGEEEFEAVAVSAFKARSVELIERVASGRVGPLVLTEWGCPVAAVAPVRERQGSRSSSGAPCAG